ncbi:hypothetical protein NQ315_011761 [Exocentrus adspersus]|uniref:BOD1/SHG1 domain-containing protein n=1 Tax=Exocentrus adspersus TaxID=1586481 RepID=A0AAV8W235_9CUCU|nr:hypothetical protein NQ315_011761 [Exocentrus adspersus]
MEVVANSYMPGDPRLVEQLVYELKSQGIFDQFRKECISDVDTKPAYQNLRQRVEGTVATFLSQQTWRPDMNKNQVREQLRKNIYESGYLETGVERIVDQVVNPKINTVFLPQVEDVVYKYLGIEKPNRSEIKKELKIDVADLLPTDLEAISPESDHAKDDKNPNEEETKDVKMEEDESPLFEPIDVKSNNLQPEENSVDSHLSGFSGLQSHDSNQFIEAKMDLSNQDSQVSQNSSESRLSIDTSEDNVKMEVQETPDLNLTQSNDSSSQMDISPPDTQVTSDSNSVQKDEIKVAEEVQQVSAETNGFEEKKPEEVEIEKKVNPSDEKQNEDKKPSDKKPDDKKSRSSDKLRSKDKKDDKHRKSSSSSSSRDKDRSNSKHGSSSSKDKDKSKDRKEYKSSSSKDKEKIKDSCYKSEKDKDGHKSVKDKDSHKSEKDKNGKDTSKSDKDGSKIEKSKDNVKSEKDKDAVKSDKNKIKSEKDKDKTKSEKYKERKDKDRTEKDTKSSRDKDRSGKDKEKDKSSGSSKHNSSKDNDKISTSAKPDSSKKDKSHSSSSKEGSKSKSCHSDAKSKSSDKAKMKESSSKHSNSSSSSKKDKDKKRESRKDVKDDHYSSKDKKNDRRSTDRDSNDGRAGRQAQLQHPLGDARAVEEKTNHQDSSNSNSGSGTGDSGASDQCKSMANRELSVSLLDLHKFKYAKPKFASNFEEARKLMKIRKQLAKLERQNQLSLAQVPGEEVPLVNGVVCVEKTPAEVKIPETSPSILNTTELSQANWEALEARLAQEMSNVNYDSYESPYEDYDCTAYSSIVISPKKEVNQVSVDVEKAERDNKPKSPEQSHQDEVDKPGDAEKETKEHRGKAAEVGKRHEGNTLVVLLSNTIQTTIDNKINDIVKKTGPVKITVSSDESGNVGNSCTEMDVDEACDPDACTHLEPNSPSLDKNLQFLYKYIDKLEQEVKHSLKACQNNFAPLKRRYGKRKLNDTVDLKNNNNKAHYEQTTEGKKRKRSVAANSKGNEKLCNSSDILPNQNFSLPLSPAESEKSVDKKEEESPKTKQKREAIGRGVTLRSQRYSSEDLYKPRPIFPSTRRSRGAKNAEK